MDDNDDPLLEHPEGAETLFSIVTRDFLGHGVSMEDFLGVGGGAPMVLTFCLEGIMYCAIDGTGEFSSKKIHCDQCCTKTIRSGTIWAVG